MFLIRLNSGLSLARNFTQRKGRTLLPLHISLIFSVFLSSLNLPLWDFDSLILKVSDGWGFILCHRQTLLKGRILDVRNGSGLSWDRFVGACVCHGATCIMGTANSVSLMICNEARNSEWSLGPHLSQAIKEGLSGPWYPTIMQLCGGLSVQPPCPQPLAFLSYLTSLSTQESHYFSSRETVALSLLRFCV